MRRAKLLLPQCRFPTNTYGMPSAHVQVGTGLHAGTRGGPLPAGNYIQKWMIPTVSSGTIRKLQVVISP